MTRLEHPIVDVWRSLKTRIAIAAVLALLLGIGLISVLLVSQAERDMVKVERQRELGEAARTAALLSRRVVSLQRALQVVAFQFPERLMNDGAALAQFLEEKPVLRSLFSDLVVIAPDGSVRMMADQRGIRPSDTNLGDREYFLRTLTEGRPVISGALASRLSGQPVVVLAQPIRGATGVVGVLAGSLPLSSRDLLEGLVEANEPDINALVVVTDAGGRVLTHPNTSRIMQPLSEEPRLAQAFAAWLSEGGAVEPMGLPLPQSGQVVSAAGVAGPDWMVWRASPESRLLAPLRDARRNATTWTFALIVLLTASLLIFLWRLLRPLKLLQDRAEHLFDGTLLPREGWPDAGGEIGALTAVLRRVGIERAHLEALNAQTLNKLTSVMSAAPVGIAFLRDDRFELVSGEFCRLFRREAPALIGQSARLLFASDEDHAAHLAQEAQALRANQAYVVEWRMVRANGTRFWARLRIRPVDATDASLGTIWTLNDIEDQRQAREALEWSATHDALTGLANRQVFEQRAGRLIQSLPASLPAAMVFIDLDRFKPVNDSAGHVAGDLMLRAVAGAITSCVRSNDLVVRIGGDEFALLLERCSQARAMRIGQAVADAVAAISLPWAERTLRVTASVGVASLEPGVDALAVWVQAADAASYRAKAAGGNQVRSWDEPIAVGPDGPEFADTEV